MLPEVVINPTEFTLPPVILPVTPTLVPAIIPPTTLAPPAAAWKSHGQAATAAPEARNPRATRCDSAILGSIARTCPRRAAATTMLNGSVFGETCNTCVPAPSRRTDSASSCASPSVAIRTLTGGTRLTTRSGEAARNMVVSLPLHCWGADGKGLRCCRAAGVAPIVATALLAFGHGSVVAAGGAHRTTTHGTPP